jgi:hypothetical protein
MRKRRNPSTRVIIGRGLLYGGYEPHDMPGAYIVLTYQVYELDGTKSRGSYDGPGEIVWQQGARNDLVLGNTDNPQAFLTWLAVDKEPTREALEYDRGYRKGWNAKRRPTVPATASGEYADGLRAGWTDRSR